VLQRPNVFGALAAYDDSTLDKVLAIVSAKKKKPAGE